MSTHKKDIDVCRDMLVLLERNKVNIDALDVLLEKLPKVLDERRAMTPDDELKRVLDHFEELERGYRSAAQLLDSNGRDNRHAANVLRGAADGMKKAAIEMRNWGDIPF